MAAAVLVGVLGPAIRSSRPLGGQTGYPVRGASGREGLVAAPSKLFCSHVLVKPTTCLTSIISYTVPTMAANIRQESQIQAALAAYRKNEFSSIERAAEAYSIAPRTLHRRAKDGLIREESHEGERKLNPLEESEMVRWIEELTERNIPARVGMLNGMANTILRARQPLPDYTAVSKQWYQEFLGRHPNLQTRFSRALDHAWSTALSKPLVERWFNQWQKTLEDYIITLDNVYNMDETGIMMGVLERSLVVVPRSLALRYMRQPGNKN